jgi:hypothetical protein
MTVIIAVTCENIDNYFSEMELYLNSYFDSSYSVNPERLILENDTYRITYVKNGTIYSMSIDILSPSIDTKEYTLTYEGEFKDKLRKPMNPMSFKITAP